MRFKIEYLRRQGDDQSIVYVSRSEAHDAAEAARQARERARQAHRLNEARSFQIRDLAADGRIVAQGPLGER